MSAHGACCVLVHGYLGSPEDLAPLARALAGAHGPGAVRSVLLPGHGAGRAPPFDAAAFAAEVRRAAEGVEGPLVLVGHSTGGSVLLAAAASLPRPPALAILAATPPRVDAGYAARWSRHAGASGPPLEDVAALVSLVNGLARTRHPFPILALAGEADLLVPAADAEAWHGRGAAVRVVRIAGGEHDLFAGAAGAVAVDVAVRAVRDAIAHAGSSAGDARWAERVPAVARAVARWPATLRHLRDGPAGRALDGRAADAEEVAETEPTILDVSVTTRCTLACSACARTLGRVEPGDMAPATFARVLEQVPHAARVVLVGLGEPLLHPGVVDLVRHAAGAGRSVSLVTNGIRLDAATSRALLDAGLSALTVSLDAVSAEGVARARPGTPVETVLAHLRGFVDERRRAGREREVGVAVFTALAADTADELPGIVDAVAPIGVDALMATDLNFPENAPRSLHRALGAEAAARLDRTLRGALARGLPILSVHGLEELALPERFRELLLLRGAALAARAARHAHCRSPWQTLPVGPDGEVTLCDCQPFVPLGNVLRDPLSAIWNGEAMRAHRRRMRSDAPPPACLACPRF